MPPMLLAHQQHNMRMALSRSKSKEPQKGLCRLCQVAVLEAEHPPGKPTCLGPLLFSAYLWLCDVELIGALPLTACCREGETWVGLQSTGLLPVAASGHLPHRRRVERVVLHQVQMRLSRSVRDGIMPCCFVHCHRGHTCAETSTHLSMYRN